MNMVMRWPVALKGAAMAVGLFFAMSLPSVAETLLPVPFQTTETGQMRDPTGLWSPAEVAEGGSDVQPSVWFASRPVDVKALTRFDFPKFFGSFREEDRRIGFEQIPEARRIFRLMQDPREAVPAS